MKHAVMVEQLIKSYGSNTVLKGISFQVNQGEIFAVLGVNGAGKTTLLECMEGLRKYDSGTVQIEGNCGVQLQSASLPENIKAKEALELFAKWKHTKIDKTSLEFTGIKEFLNKQYTQLSTGQKRRLHLAISLLGNPDILFLDEPTAGLDVEGRVHLHKALKELKSQGKTMILSSHDMAEVEELCDRIAILKDGELAFIGSSMELTERIQTNYLIQLYLSSEPDFSSLINSTIQRKAQGCYTFQTTQLTDALDEIIQLLKSEGLEMKDISVDKQTLEQSFLTIAKGEG